MPTHRSYHSYLIESLQDPQEAAAYLDAALEDGDPELVLRVLKDIAEAHRSSDDGSDELNSIWERYYQSLEESKVPELPLLVGLLSELGLRLSVTVKTGQEEVEQVA